MYVECVVHACVFAHEYICDGQSLNSEMRQSEELRGSVTIRQKYKLKRCFILKTATPCKVLIQK